MLADVGISKTAFYKHFECKEDLVLAALEQQNRWLQETFREMVRQRGGDTAVGQLRALLDVVDQIIDADEFQGFFRSRMTVEAAMQLVKTQRDRFAIDVAKSRAGERHRHGILLAPVPEVEAAVRGSNLNTTGGFDVRGDAERPIRVLARVGPDPARVIADLKQVVVKPPPARLPGHAGDADVAAARAHL